VAAVGVALLRSGVENFLNDACSVLCGDVIASDDGQYVLLVGDKTLGAEDMAGVSINLPTHIADAKRANFVRHE
jgi:hypothetical protein